MNVDNFKDDVKVNRFRLEQECEAQPSLYHNWAEELASAKAAADRADNRLKLLLAETESAIRQEQKMTEAAYKIAVELDESVQKARQDSLAAWSDVYHLEAAVKALDHRKAELDNLVQLWIKGYYSRPDGGKPTAGDDVAADVRKNLNRKRGQVDENTKQEA